MDDDPLNRAIAAARAGRKAEARALLARLLQREADNATAWLWLSGAVETDEERRHCLMRVLEIDPASKVASQGLEALPREAAIKPATPSASAAPVRSTDRRDRQSRLLITIGGVMVVLACVLGIAALAAGRRGDFPEARPLQETPYVIVYGRQECSLTRQLMDGLEQRGIPYTFKSVDKASVAEELHPRMRAAGLLDDGTYNLPVVDVSGTLLIRPSVSTVLSLYASS
jgi:hypothetical protein